MPKVNRLREIDFLRGIAVILVLFRHHKFFQPLFDSGWMGVDLFFVLSGYLVSSLLFREYQRSGRIKPLRFLIRRGFKIYPIFYVAVGLTVLLDIAFEHEINRFNLMYELIFLQNYFAGLWNHTWSLAIEEHFYFGLTAIILLVITAKLIEKRAVMLGIFIAVMLACLLLRIDHSSVEYSHRTHIFYTHFRIDSLMFGVLLAYLHHFSKATFEAFFMKYTLPLLIFAMACISTAFVFYIDHPFMHTFGLTLLYLGFGSILMIFIINKKTNKRLDQVLSKYLVNFVAKVGLYSYGIYVFHMFVSKYEMPLLKDAGMDLNFRIEFLIYFASSILLGMMMSLVIEKPFLILREKIAPRSSKKSEVTS